MIRILHFSDPHLAQGARPTGFDKRWVGYGNLLLRRRYHHRDVEEKLSQLGDLAHRIKVDLAICTGDLTALGTEPELSAARKAVSRFESLPLGLFVFRGNHDVYLHEDGLFEQAFHGLVETDLPEVSIDGRWPLVRLYGEELAVIALNSTRPNPQPWRSSGIVREEELDALEAALAHPRLSSRTVLLTTHYGLFHEDGRPDTWRHGIANARTLVSRLNSSSLCRERVTALLHGHIHRCYTLRPAGFAFPVLSAGSATYEGREGFWLFELEHGRLRAFQGSRRDGEYLISQGPVAL